MTLKLRLTPRPSIIARVTPRLSGVTLVAGDNINVDQVGSIYTISANVAVDALAYNGMQVNGSMEVSQENGSSLVPVSGTPSGAYVIDQWAIETNGPQSISAGRNAFAPAGFAAALQLYMGVANASPSAAQYSVAVHYIEGYRISRLGWGTASAQPVTIGFWIAVAHTGTYSGCIKNGIGNRSYVFDYTATGGAFEYKTVTIPGDTAGTWATDNALGLSLVFTILNGSNFVAASGAWTAGNYLASANTNMAPTVGDQVFITGVVVLPGTQTLTATQSPFIMRPYDQELMTCHRYYYNGDGDALGLAATAYHAGGPIQFKNTMRAAPTCTGTFTANAGSAGTATFINATSNGVGVYNGAGNWTVTALINFATFRANARL